MGCKSAFRALSFVCLVLLFAGCGGEKIKGGQVTVRNDLLDKTFNKIVVDSIVTSRGATGYRKTFKPGQEEVLPFKGIRKMRFSRKYADHSMVYMVTCPRDFNTKVMFKLIDVHTNRLDGGCVLRKRGRKERGIVDWE